MKKAFLAGAGIAATLFGGQAFAATGYLDVNYVGLDSGVGSATHSEGITANGSLALGDIGYFGLQGDVGAFSANLNTGNSYSSEYASLHAYHRYGANQFGAVFGIASVDTTSKQTPYDIGLEYQHHAENTTLTLSAAYLHPDHASSQGVAVQAGITGYVTDHFSLGAGVGWLNSDNNTAAKTDGVLLNLNTEVQIASLPISVIASYDDFQTSDTAFEQQSLSVGLRYTFGADSLKARDRSGPSLPSQGNLLNIAGSL